MVSEVIPLMPPLVDLPAEVQVLRDDRHRAFAWAYAFNGANGAAAARVAGFSDTKEGAKVRAHALLQRDDINEALRALCTKYLFSFAPKAIFRLGQLLDKPNHKQHAKAIEMTLSRTGFTERTSVDVNVTGRVQVDHTQSSIDDLRRLKAMGVPRDKLIEVFGYSGLSRYEKLLAAEDAKALAAPIDAEYTEIPAAPK